jgi:L-fuculokinase
MQDATIVLDIGKTNVKLTLLAADGSTLSEQRIANRIVQDGRYPHHDTERIWNWLLDTCRSFAALAHVSAIVPVTHGATAALVDADGLVLPVLDYEAALPTTASDYDRLRPSFAATLSPNLPLGLNLGRQLHWLSHAYPAEFARASHLLMYPQYWAWRLCGVAAAEVTSLGCHTDLWNPTSQQYSKLVADLRLGDLMPPLTSAWSALGSLLPALARSTGLPADCQVLCGIHDSNASLLRHLDGDDNFAARTVLSTGTWMIAAAFGAPLGQLREHQDMLANTNARGEAVACMRFMGGREFGVLAGADPQICDAADIAQLVQQGTLALPSFAESGGPFAGQAGSMIGPAPDNDAGRYALATLYCALMTDYCLSALGSSGPITVEGSFAGNPYFGALLAALRPTQAVIYSGDASGTTCGAWMLHRQACRPASDGTAQTPLAMAGLAAYRDRWLAALA